MKCKVSGCSDEATEYVLAIIGGEDRHGNVMPRQQVKIDICIEHHRQFQRGTLSMGEFSVGRSTPRHLKNCRYSAQNGWECGFGCPTHVAGLHSA